MGKKVSSNITTLGRIVSGVKKVNDLVRASYGPSSGIVILQRGSGILPSTDGATIMREISLPDALENMGCQVVREASLIMDETVGDGTTTVVILAAKIIEEAYKVMVSGVNPAGLIKDIKDAADTSLLMLEEVSEPIRTKEEATRVAQISSGNDIDASRAIVDAVMAIGKEGNISIEDGFHTENIDVVYSDGMDVKCKVASSVMLNGGATRSLVEPLVAIIDNDLSSVDDVKSIMEESSAVLGGRPLLIVANSVCSDALSTIVVNDRNGVIKCCAVEAPSYGQNRSDILDDIAIASGATVVRKIAGMDYRRFETSWLGYFISASVKDNKALFINSAGRCSDINQTVKELMSRRNVVAGDSERDRISKRIARLSSSYCILRIGARTDSERRERMARIEDALKSVRNSIEMGVLPGGGLAYWMAADFLDCESPASGSQIGHRILSRALREPLKLLCSKSKHPDKMMYDLERRRSNKKEAWIGVDLNQDFIRDLHTDPMIIDPHKVVREAIKLAVSVSTTLMMSGAVVYQ